MTQMDTKKGINEAFIDASEKLTKYMNGENDAKEVMDATKPQTVVFVMKDKVQQDLNVQSLNIIQNLL